MNCTKIETTAADLAGLNLFGELDREQLAFIAASCVQKTTAKGSVICQVGCRIPGIYYQLEGKTKLAIASSRGTERVVKIVVKGQTFGEAFVFHSAPLPLYAQALQPSRLLLIRKKIITETIQRWPALALPMLDQIGAFSTSVLRNLETCCLQNAQQRVAGFLVNNAEPGNSTAQLFEVILPAGKALVASSLNLTPETFSRELHHLTQKELIQTDRRRIVIRNMRALRAICP
jgi:CRP-like cAMP-binding protein